MLMLDSNHIARIEKVVLITDCVKAKANVLLYPPALKCGVIINT